MAKLINHGEAVVVSLHLCGVGMPRVVTKEVVAEFLAGDEEFAEAGRIFDISGDGKIEEFEGAVDGGGGALFVSLFGPFERARYLAADVAHLVGDGIFAPVFAELFAMNIV